MILKLVRNFHVSKYLYDALTCLLICVQVRSWLLMDWFKFKGLKELDMQESPKTGDGMASQHWAATRRVE